MSKYSAVLGKQIIITIDRPLGSFHPDYPDHHYPINYGYVVGALGGDGEAQDVYLLGVDVPVASYQAVVIAVIHHYDDIETKWVAAPPGMRFSNVTLRPLAWRHCRRYFSSDCSWQGSCI